MIVKANARLVISLEVKRIDNNLSLRGVVLPIAFEDVINIDKLGERFLDIVHYATPSKHISEKHVIDEALRIMRAKYNYLHHFGVSIVKNIPTGHGLGSGASDAMAVLKAAARLSKLKLTKDEFMELACELKQDVPYFAVNEPAVFLTNTQEVKPIKFKHKPYVLLIIHPTTMEKTNVMARYLAKDLSSTSNLDAVVNAVEKGSLSDIGNHVFNDFSEVIMEKVPALHDVLRFLGTQELEAYGIAGTGATIFALSNNKNLLKLISDKYKKQNYQTIITRVITKEKL